MIWVKTSSAYPEQYDIYTNSGLYTAYFRLRHGNLYVHPIKHGEIDWDTVLFEKHYYDERGCFEDDDQTEFTRLKIKINFKIRFYRLKETILNLLY